MSDFDSDAGTCDEIQYVVTHGTVDLEMDVEGAPEECVQATFEIYRADDDSLVTTLQGELVGGKATARWEPDIQPEGEHRGLRVYYVVEVDIQKHRSQELEVYLDWVEIESVGEDDAALPDCTYALKVNGEQLRTGSTGSAGKFREVGLPPGDVEVEWTGPIAVVEWLDRTGPTRKAKLRKLKRVAFLWPSPEGEGEGGRRTFEADGTGSDREEKFHAHRQLVNLDADPAHPERGSRLRCRVAVHPQAEGKAGDEVYVKVEWPPADELSKRNDPVRELVGGAAQPWAQGDRCKGLKLALAADQGEVTFELELGLAGRDAVTISIGCNDECEDAKLVVTNWRQTWYQKTLAPDVAWPDIGTATGWFDTCGVSFDPDGDVVPFGAGPAAGSGVPGKQGLSLVPGIWFWNLDGDPPEGDVAIVGNHNWLHFSETVFLARQGDRGLHVVVCNRVCHGTDHTGAPYSQQVRAVEATALELTIPLPAPDGMTLFDRAVHDGDFPVRGCRWTGPTDASVPEELRNKSGVIPEAWIICQATGDQELTIYIPNPDDEPDLSEDEATPGRIIAAGGKLLIDADLCVASTGFAGWAFREQVALARDSGDDAQFNCLLTHEVGHCMHQAAAEHSPAEGWEAAFYCPPGLAFTDHPHGYQLKGHVGGHCNFGMTPADQGLATYDGLTQDRLGTCVMYGQLGDPARNVGFCEHCQKFTRAFDMKALR